MVNNKIHLTTKTSPFLANYKREMRMGVDLKRKEKVEKATEFTERMRKVQEEAGVALMRVQKEIKRQVDRGRREAENWKVGDRVILSTKGLVFKERLVKKLMERYVELYEVEEVVLKNIVKLKLLSSMRIHPVVNVSRVVRYREPVRGQRTGEPKPIEVDRVEEWEVKKILNKRKIQGVERYLVR